MIYLTSILSALRRFWREGIIVALILALIISFLSFNAKTEQYKANLKEYENKYISLENSYKDALLKQQNTSIEKLNAVTTKYEEIKIEYEAKEQSIADERKHLNGVINSLSNQITNIRDRSNSNQGGNSTNTTSVQGGTNQTVSKELSNVSNAFAMCINEYADVAEIADKLTESVKTQDNTYKTLIEQYNTQ